MPLEVGLWRVDGGKPVKVPAKGVPLESQLEVMIEAVFDRLPGYKVRIDEAEPYPTISPIN